MTNTADTQPIPDLPRVPTLVPGLDEITRGGLLRAGVYILQGMPGAGKTILANQIAHRHAAAGGHVVYVTLLAESHARLMQHLHNFRFFDPASVPQRVYYVSAFDALRTGGLKGVVELLRSEMRTRRAGILVLDGLVMAASAAESDEQLKVFISDIQSHSALIGCTTLLLTSEDPDRPVSAEQTMVDGIVLLREASYGPHRERKLEVIKFRGSDTLRGRHTFRIGEDGIQVYPRLEAARRSGPEGKIHAEGVSSGVPGLDAMFGVGGYARGSVNVVMGPSGSGKTTLGLHFLAATPPGEKAFCFSFYESPEFLRAIGRHQGIDPAGRLEAVAYAWNPFGENLLDDLAAQLLGHIERERPSRVVVDGIGGFYAAPSFAERGSAFITTLMNELRRMGPTTLITVEERLPESRTLDTATMSALADTIVSFRVTHDDAVRRHLWIGKSRASRTDAKVRETRMGPRGVEVITEGTVLGS